MKAILLPIFKRTSIVVLASVLLLTVLQFVPRGYVPPFLCIAVVFFGSLLWANGILFKRGHPVLAALFSLFLVPTLGFPVGVGASLLGRSLTEWRYKVQGIQMVDRCNGATANEADFQVHEIEGLLNDLRNCHCADTNTIVQLLKAYPVAQEKARLLDDDCGWRGHSDKCPWKTDWDAVTPALSNAEHLLRQSTK